MNQETLQLTWAAFFVAIDSERHRLKMLLAEHYYPLVKKFAIRLHQRLADAADQDDLNSNGVFGLLDAIEHYDPDRKTKFETYAMQRIRGSMLDAIRVEDWVPRLVRSKANYLDKQRQVLESRVGYKMSNAEFAERLAMDESEFENFIQSATPTAVHGMIEMDGDTQQSVSVENVMDKRTPQPVEKVIRREFFDKLLGRHFTNQERQLIKLHYYDERSIKDISATLGLSESRVSQMHNTVLKRLGNQIKNNPVYFNDVMSILSSSKEKAPKL